MSYEAQKSWLAANFPNNDKAYFDDIDVVDFDSGDTIASVYRAPGEGLLHIVHVLNFEPTGKVDTVKEWDGCQFDHRLPGDNH